MNTVGRLVLVLTASFLLPVQALAQSAPPPKPQVVVQTSSPPAQVVVQGNSAPAAPVPAEIPAALPKPTLSLQLPTSVMLGETLKAQVALSGPDGAPINGAAIDVSTAVTFLNTQSNVIVGQGHTDSAGVASVEWEPRSTGNLTLTAAFGGNNRFAAATANATLVVRGDSQLYEQQAGVVVPGLNAAPGSTAMAALPPAQISPWPKLSGWPLVVVLAIVWSLYGRAVWNLFRIARAGEREPATGGAR